MTTVASPFTPTEDDIAEFRRLHQRLGDAVETAVHGKRGTIDLVLVAHELMVLRGVSESSGKDYQDLVLEAMLVALSGRIHLNEAAGTTPERVLREIWEDRFVLEAARAEPG